ncbi:leucine-rich repeat-containing protein 70-like [Tribolium madens]|uniref:leucine-rich repeat-containing protein 70-like n=1 Tax=Tribolium madens TaxID=41895 RepID=UPI001CF72746|nr:leucine-rich repeat-containing protein 70-like [Tribolium madens]
MFLKIIFLGLCLIFSVFGWRDEYFRKNNLTFVVEPEGIYRLLGYSPAENLTAGIIANIEDVQTLYLLDDSIREIQPGAFQDLPKLKNLLIQYNEISKIPAGIFNNLPKLTYLELGDNGISYIDPHAFDNLTRLTSIGLGNNKLDKIDSHWFEDKPALTYIQLTGNLIKKISADSFKSLKGRKSMSVFLGDNPVETIENDALKGFEEISVLSLENLNLTSPEAFLQGLKIGTLEFNRNKFKCVEEEAFERVFVADTTEMKSNPLEAECLNKIQLWAQKHNKIVISQ